LYDQLANSVVTPWPSNSPNEITRKPFKHGYSKSIANELHTHNRVSLHNSNFEKLTF